MVKKSGKIGIITKKIGKIS